MDMTEYHKINSLYKRDKRGNFLPEYAAPEFEYLADNLWILTEKVDGTNIRIGYDEHQHIANAHQYIAGRTNNAQIPPKLLTALVSLVQELPFGNVFDCPATLYGEGYGAGIQSGGNYRPDPAFVLFDVRVGDYWLRRADVEDVAAKLELDVVPLISGGSTLNVAEQLVKEGFTSAWGNFKAEGVVATPIEPLFNRKGERIITKVKTKDYR